MVFLFTAPQKLDRARVADREMNNVASAQTESESPCLIFFSCCRGARPKGLILKTVCVTEWQSVCTHTHTFTLPSVYPPFSSLLLLHSNSALLKIKKLHSFCSNNLPRKIQINAAASPSQLVKRNRCVYEAVICLWESESSLILMEFVWWSTSCHLKRC